MNLVIRFLAVRRDRMLMRLGCWLVSFSLVLGLMLPQQRAQAVEPITMTAVASLAAAYLCACGLTFVTQGMDKDALASSVQRLIQEFLDTELGGISIHDWLGNVWNVAVLAGKLVMGRPLTEEFMGFAQWVAGKYAANVGMNAVFAERQFYLSNGELIVYGLVSSNSMFAPVFVPSEATLFSFDKMYEFSFGSKFGVFKENGKLFFEVFNASRPSFSGRIEITTKDSLEAFLSASGYYLAYWPSSNFSATRFGLMPVASCGSSFVSLSYSLATDNGYLLAPSVNESLSIDRAPSMSYIPEGIEAEQGIALDVGAAATMDLDMVLQGVLDDVLAGTLTSTMEAAGEEVVDPPAEELPDVDELGLPALGAALTSRFPFSIPWDFFRAVKLVAAPAKAPRFEVDFMAPIEHRVGQWQGDTTIVLDFSEYAIIGQISRWTSTIGFCLMLAGATKRLIWTA